MLIKWNVPTVGIVTMLVPEARVMRFLSALSLLGFDAEVEMS